MQKAPNPKLPGNPGHNEKNKPKDNRYRRKQRFPNSRANIFNKIIEENFPNLKKEMHINIQDTYRTSSRLHQKKKFLPSYKCQNTKCTKQRKNIKNS